MKPKTLTGRALEDALAVVRLMFARGRTLSEVVAYIDTLIQT